MEFTIGLAQCRHAEDGNEIASIERIVKDAKASGMDLLVFPEALMSSTDEPKQRFLDEAQPTYGPFSHAVDAIAAKQGLWMVYTINEANPDGNPFNTTLISDDTGKQRATYRKTHLFDTDTKRESDLMTAGDTLFDPIDTPFGKLGLGVCY